MIGIDNLIDGLKTKLTAKIAGLTAYGRAYKNEREDGVIPEIQTAGTQEYKEVLIDTGITGLCFFIVENDYEVSDGTMNTTDVDLYFAVNLKLLYPTVSERATEYLHQDVQNILKYSRFNLQSITSGRESFDDFADEYIKIGDNMQPYYLCKFSTEIEYNINEC